MRNEIPVPAIMYHTVGIPNRNWEWQHLTCPYGVFEEQMKWLHRKGYQTITLDQLYNYIFDYKGIPEKSIILTFDDGYADNWIFAFPIMKRYGMKGTVFVNPEFADERKIIRKRVDNLSCPCQLSPSEISGFLSWEEMREAEDENVFDIQSHAMSHTWYPSSDRIIDFRHPGDKYIWMTWNRNKNIKSELQFDRSELVDLGAPVYEFSKSLESRRYFPNPDLSRSLIEFVKENGGKDFFDQSNWRGVLFEKTATLENEMESGRHETEEEFHARIREEITRSKQIIEDKLNKKIEYLCWPGGSSTKKGLEIAREAGYKMTTTGRDLDRRERLGLLNLPSQKSDRIARISPFLYWDGVPGKNSKAIYDSGFTLALKLIQYRNSGLIHYWARFLRKCIKEIRKGY